MNQERTIERPDAVARGETTGPSLSAELAGALAPGAVLLRAGRVESADARARELLGLREIAEIAGVLAHAGVSGVPCAPALLPLGAQGRQLLIEVRALAGAESAGDWTLVLLRDPAALAAITTDVEQACHLRTITRISPAVAHDLRAPINAMVFNLEILKETIAAGKGAEASGRERQLRYVTVLRDELTRLHRELETFLAQTSGKGDRSEEVDLRETVGELVALLVPMGRKIQVQARAELPGEPVTVTANRWRLRQALLQVGVAALARIGHPGILAAALATSGGRARLTLAGPAPDPIPAMPAPPPGEESFELDLSAREPEGRPRLFVARALLAAQGAELRAFASPGGEVGYAIEWPVSAKPAVPAAE